MNFKFSFSSVTRDEDETENKLLDASKSRPFIDILTKIVKYNQDISPNFITRSFNSETSTSRFPTTIKNAKVEAVFKNNSRTNKTIYNRPVSLLPVICKAYERLNHKKVPEYFEHILSKYQCGFRKGCRAQHCLQVMVEKWKKLIDKKGICGALMSDSSEVFNCFPHKLLFTEITIHMVLMNHF